MVLSAELPFLYAQRRRRLPKMEGLARRRQRCPLHAKGKARGPEAQTRISGHFAVCLLSIAMPAGARAAILGVAMGRHLNERLALRAPWLSRRLFKLLLALPPRSSVRRRALKRVGKRAWEAFSRGDDELGLLFVDRDVEINNIGFEALGLAERYHGHPGALEFRRLWLAEWAGSQITHTPEALIDLGDRLVWRVTLTARGATSGADVAQTMGFVHWWADGAIVRSDAYWKWPECVAALGLDDALAVSR
jgi:ketosteroid isomerase-like protein